MQLPAPAGASRRLNTRTPPAGSGAAFERHQHGGRCVRGKHGPEAGTFVPPQITDPDGKKRLTSNPNVQNPNWLTTDGHGTATGNSDFGSTVQIDGKKFSKLGDFENPDQLGRALGESGYHASVHSRLGNTMSGFASPRDAAFEMWHGHIKHLVQRWRQTPNGQNWTKAGRRPTRTIPC